MFDTPEEEIEFSLPNAYAIQITGGTESQRTQLINDTYPSPRVEVDCTNISDYDEFINTLNPQLSTDPSNYFSDEGHISEHFQQEGGSLVIYNVDVLNDRTLRAVSTYIKGLAEQTPVKIALTAEDTGAIYRGNGDLSARVRRVDLSEY